MLPTQYVPVGSVANAKAQFERLGAGAKKPILDNLMDNMNKVQPGLGELIAKEKPLIAELMVKLKNRELERDTDYSSDGYSLPGNSMSSSESAYMMDPVTSDVTSAPPPKSPKRARTKTALEKCLAQPDSKKKFREFMASKGASEDLEFWEACDDCEKKAHGWAVLAKKIISQLIKEIKETNGHPEKAHMDLALNSAVVAVRYEMMLHKEEIRDLALGIVDKFVRDNAPNRVNLSTEIRNAVISTVDNARGSDSENSAIVSKLVLAKNEIRDLMEKRHFDEFSS